MLVSTIVRAFNTRSEAARAVDELMAQGFTADDVSVHTKNGKVADLGSGNAGLSMAPSNAAADLDTDRDAEGRRTGEDVHLDEERGGILPVFGVASAGGGSSGATMGGGYAGGLVGYFASEGLSDEDARRHADAANAGKYLVAVRANSGNEVQAEAAMGTAGALPQR